jgi:HK97 family phage prohead protease
MINKFTISDAKVLDDRAGIVEAYVNTMGVRDADGDIIDPAAFNASIKSNLPIPVLAGHDQSKLVGKVLFAQAEPVGTGNEHRLYTRMQLNMDTQAGQEAFSNISGEFIREWSVGFNLPAGDAVVYDRAGKTTVRRILDLDWVEVSAVIRGASPSTSTIGVKSATVKAPDTYSTREDAESRADELGCSGAHRMEVDGESVWMPCSTHSAYETAAEGSRYAAPDPEVKPYPNFHACRILEPDAFDRFRTSSETIEDGDFDGKSMEILFGRHAESGAWSLTSYRMPVEQWTETEARSFCRSHDGILFEPATGESMSDDPVGAASDTVMVGLVPLLTASDTASQRLRLARMRLTLQSNR